MSGRAIHDVDAERHRQVLEEGYTEQHDDTHNNGELALAAMAYACPEHVSQFFDANDIRLWPFAGEPAFNDRRHDLVRAAALLIAEIERIDRAAGGPGGCPLCGKLEAHTHEM